MSVLRGKGKMGYVIAVFLGALVVLAIFMPQVRGLWLNLRAEEIQIASSSAGSASPSEETLDLKIITVLGKDGIPAILDPQFLSGALALNQMSPTERVLGVSINGEHRAYPLNLLSRHEIVNDTVGGEPVAVTW